MFLLSTRNLKSASPYPQLLTLLKNIQYVHLKGSPLNFTKYFNLFDTKANLGCRLLDSFPDCIFFHSCNHPSCNNCTAYLKSLDYLCFQASFSFSTLVVITNASAILSRNIQVTSTMYFWRLRH